MQFLSTTWSLGSWQRVLLCALVAWVTFLVIAPDVSLVDSLDPYEPEGGVHMTLSAAHSIATTAAAVQKRQLEALRFRSSHTRVVVVAQPMVVLATVAAARGGELNYSVPLLT